ncbi:hypothetical protein PsorP6_002024 [Peronosclerospora sorghi]|uniref:Uncharacterized protein n=1 Tax=Peronosclerospora sorghi TaxID=230839 RepID=A0ACC0WVV8_9STRA|nr:hypothetical protein PsorP6_002024 [Peronosclerospora sorghi]
MVSDLSSLSSENNVLRDCIVIALFLSNFYNGESGTRVFDVCDWYFETSNLVLRTSPRDRSGQRNEAMDIEQFFICLLCNRFMLTLYGTINISGSLSALYFRGSVIDSVLLMSANVKTIFLRRCHGPK